VATLCGHLLVIKKGDVMRPGTVDKLLKDKIKLFNTINIYGIAFKACSKYSTIMG